MVVAYVIDALGAEVRTTETIVVSPFTEELDVMQTLAEDVIAEAVAAGDTDTSALYILVLLFCRSDLAHPELVPTGASC